MLKTPILFDLQAAAHAAAMAQPSAASIDAALSTFRAYVSGVERDNGEAKKVRDAALLEREHTVYHHRDEWCVVFIGGSGEAATIAAKYRSRGSDIGCGTGRAMRVAHAAEMVHEFLAERAKDSRLSIRVLPFGKVPGLEGLAPSEPAATTKELKARLLREAEAATDLTELKRLLKEIAAIK